MTMTQAWDEVRARALIDALKDLPGASLPILHSLQSEFGYIYDEAIPLVAEALALSKAEVVGVIDFYTDFRKEPAGRHILRVCRAESCQALGSDALVDHIEQTLGVGMGETTSDGAITLETRVLPRQLRPLPRRANRRQAIRARLHPSCRQAHRRREVCP